MRPFTPGGGRREIAVACPSCGSRSSVPPAAVARNNYFCSGCGKSLDLTQAFRPLPPGEEGLAPTPRRDRGNSKYKSARKGRR